jgi:choice-of-anchor B domain-containing protein
MRQIALLLALLGLQTLPAQTNVAYQGKLGYPGQNLANIWGYAAGGREYALVGAQNGLSIVDVTDPSAPSEIVQIPGPSSEWREIKTYQNYAYVVSEGGGGVQIVDLSNLPSPTLNYHSYYGNGTINNLLQRAHALHVDESKGYLYIYGSYLSNNTNGGRALILNLNADPYNPTYAGKFNSTFSGNQNYIHDGYVDNDILYGGHIGGGFFSIVNVTNKSNPTLVATMNTPSNATHNTWLNGTTLFTTDETSIGTSLAAYDISNTSNITLLDRIKSHPTSNSIVHNTHILNNFAITSWYKDGFTIVDVTRPANLVQVGNYDFYPGSGSGYEGCWGVYPYLPSGNIVASGMFAQSTDDGELWVFTPTYVRACYLEGTITGTVNNQVVGLNNATITIVGPSVSENSKSDGTYKMGYRQSGTYTVQVSHANFPTWTGSVALNNGMVTSLNVFLSVAPVEMLRFEAHADKTSAQLHWATASERDNTGFDVEHSTNGTTWESIGFVAGKGNSDTLAEYTFRSAPLPPGAHFFRLRQIDFDGKNTLSDVKTLEIKGPPFRADLYPTAASERCTIRLFAEKPTSVSIRILRTDGQPLPEMAWEIDLEGEATWPIEVANLPAGAYFAEIRAAQHQEILRWVKK